ncbi:hypothetical protein cpu_14150 [Carboxydothermus pertinax]|uniref:Uncharacterized protein n=1 Tax=Carboxydothermus pertinax TaxID=870242 RepID=A0A1L8CVC6_9THEO|nr:hypothetical protein cpu_14150 [Carboxydothermus pertinax]
MYTVKKVSQIRRQINVKGDLDVYKPTVFACLLFIIKTAQISRKKPNLYTHLLREQ